MHVHIYIHTHREAGGLEGRRMVGPLPGAVLFIIIYDYYP